MVNTSDVWFAFWATVFPNHVSDLYPGLGTDTPTAAIAHDVADVIIVIDTPVAIPLIREMHGPTRSCRTALHTLITSVLTHRAPVARRVTLVMETLGGPYPCHSCILPGVFSARDSFAYPVRATVAQRAQLARALDAAEENDKLVVEAMRAPSLPVFHTDHSGLDDDMAAIAWTHASSHWRYAANIANVFATAVNDVYHTAQCASVEQCTLMWVTTATAQRAVAAVRRNPAHPTLFHHARVGTALSRDTTNIHKLQVTRTSTNGIQVSRRPFNGAVDGTSPLDAAAIAIVETIGNTLLVRPGAIVTRHCPSLDRSDAVIWRALLAMTFDSRQTRNHDPRQSTRAVWVDTRSEQCPLINVRQLTMCLRLWLGGDTELLFMLFVAMMIGEAPLGTCLADLAPLPMDVRVPRTGWAIFLALALGKKRCDAQRIDLTTTVQMMRPMFIVESDDTLPYIAAARQVAMTEFKTAMSHQQWPELRTDTVQCRLVMATLVVVYQIMSSMACVPPDLPTGGDQPPPSWRHLQDVLAVERNMAFGSAVATIEYVRRVHTVATTWCNGGKYGALAGGLHSICTTQLAPSTTSTTATTHGFVVRQTPLDAYNDNDDEDSTLLLTPVTYYYTRDVSPPSVTMTTRHAPLPVSFLYTVDVLSM